MKRLIATLATLCLFVSSFSSAKDEDRSPFLFLGGYAGYNYNIHSADFSKLPGVENCCPNYTYAYGSGFSVGLLGEYPLNAALKLGLRLGYSSIGGEFKENEFIGFTEIRDLANPAESRIVRAYADHYLTSKLSVALLEPNISFMFFKDFYTTAGLRFGFMTSAVFDQKEKLTDPQNAVFKETGAVLRNTRSGLDIPEKNSFQIFGLLGVGYNLPIGKDMYLSPEIRYSIPFMNVSSVNWKAGSLFFGAAIKLPLYPSSDPIVIEENEINRDTTVKMDSEIEKEEIVLISSRSRQVRIAQNDVLINKTIVDEKWERRIPESFAKEVSISAKGLTRDGKEQAEPEFVIEETETEEFFPLLPYIFFDENSAVLDSKSLKLLNASQTNDFDEKKLLWNTMEIYSDVLNIIGSRMKSKPASKIEITGCNSGVGIEKGNLSVSQLRAEAVRDYLTNIWGIQPDRIKLKSQNLPDLPGNTEHTDGQEENRRAEIFSSDLDLLKPVYLKDIRKTANPPLVDIKPTIILKKGYKEYKIEVSQSGAILRSFSGDEAPESIVWDIEQEPIPALETPVVIKLKAIDNDGSEHFAETRINIRQLTITKKRYEYKDDKRLERYSLILFDYNRADLNQRQQQILRELKSRINPSATVTITGFTDRTGDAEYNRQLAQKRIAEAQKILQFPTQKLKTEAVGSARLLFDNDTPQGRNYCRTVQLLIETPVE